MALLSRLFSYRKNQQPQNCPTTEKNERSSCKSFTFSKEQVRVLLFRECDWRGRKLLFDSNAVQKVSLENSTCKLRFTSRQKKDQSKKDGFVEVTNGYGYQYTKPSTDATLLGEMMFGAVAMTFRGTALKVHALPNPNRLMCTKVFPSPELTHPNRRISDKSLEDSFGSSINSMTDYFSRSESEQLLENGALDVPTGGVVPGVYSSVAGDSGFCGDFSLQSISSTGSSYWTPSATSDSRHSYSSLQGGRQSGGSLSSLQRRWLRNVSTSLELGQNDEVVGCSAHHRRTKLGLTVLVTLTDEQCREMEIFIFEHMSIIETMIERLRYSVERAYLRKDMFVHLMYEGWSDIQQSMYDMLCIPRHPCPMWLNLGLNNTESKYRAGLAAALLQDLCQLISTLDTKATNFFVSTLVTGVLTHHLGWVNTVLPSSSAIPSTAVKVEANISLNELSKSHPYNPLWAQLGDLYGALGSPTKIAKTIITSNNRKADCVNKLLTVMTYFIRCGEVKESTHLPCDEMNSLANQVNVGLPSIDTLVSQAEWEEGLTDESTDVDLTNNSSTVTLKESSVMQTKIGTMLSESSSVRQASQTTDSHCSQKIRPKSILNDVEPTSSKLTCEKYIPCVAAVKPKPENSQETENVEIILPSFVSYLDDESACAGINVPICKRDMSGGKQNETNHCLVEKVSGNESGNLKLEMNCETQHLKRSEKLHSHNLKDSNFCSPAGAEWENEEYFDGLTGSGRESVQRDVTLDNDVVYFSCGQEKLGEMNAEDKQKSGEKVLSQYSGFPSSEVESSRPKYCFVSDKVKHDKETYLTIAEDSESLPKIARNGMGSMKRTSSCRKKLSDLSGKGFGLYPNIDDLAKMENIRLDENYAVDFQIKAADIEVEKPVQLSSEHINEKITKLCRVPTSSILVHLNHKDIEQKLHAQPMECFDSKRYESERQMTACDMSKFRRSKNLSVKSCNGIVERVKENEVLFVLGDSEELKGIKHRSTSDLMPVKISNGLADRDFETKYCSDNNLDVNLSTSQSNLHENHTCAMANVSNAKIVTVKASYIDMEVESGLLKTDVGGESFLKPFDTKHEFGTDSANANASKQISRSSSISLPVSKVKRVEKIAKVLRRHTDIFCHKCRSILKEKHIDNESSAFSSEMCNPSKAFLSCEKCYYTNQMCTSEGLGNFQRTKSEKIGLNLIDVDNADDISMSRQQASFELNNCIKCDIPDNSSCRNNVKTEIGVSSEVPPREKNAIFEQYNSSDDEVLCPRSMKHDSKMPDCTERLRFEDLHVVELPLPRCPSSDYSAVGLAGSLLGGVSNRYVPDLILQGCSLLPVGWETALKRDLALIAKLPLLGQDVAEAVCIVASTNTWEVQLVSSHSCVVDKPGTFGVRVGMSQLVANMLESLVHLWRLRIPPEQCLLHLERKLKELFLRSQALAELLLTTEFCNMDLLTTSLDLEANDVPLLLAIASTHSPHIANRYGLSFI